MAHWILTGWVLVDMLGSGRSPIARLFFNTIIQPFANFCCFRCCRGVIHTLHAVVKYKPLRFLINGGLIPLLVAEKVFFQYFTNKFGKDLEMDAVSLERDLLKTD